MISISLHNEGLLPAGYTVETLWQDHLSKPRNLHIANVFNKAGFIEAWGRGYKKIREEFESENAPLPTLKETCGGILMSIIRPDVGNNVGKLLIKTNKRGDPCLFVFMLTNEF